MEILAYLCLSSFVFVIGFMLFLVFLRSDARWGAVRRRILAYIGISAATSLLGLVIFETLTSLMFSSRLGHLTSFSLPRDYLARSPVGIIVLLIPILAILAPLAIAVWEIRRRDQLSG